MSDSKPSVLLISYYWPPSAGGGVHRWLKMSKYLAEAVSLFVYTPENPESPALDTASVEEVHPDIQVIKTKIKEPYSYYKKLLGKSKEDKIYSGFINEKPSLLQKFSVWIRGNFFIPDARKWWIGPSIKFLKKFIDRQKIDVVITTGPPHSMHMIGLGLKRNNDGLKWIADFRDPWTNIDFYSKLQLSRWADRKHRKLEKSVLDNADKVVTVSKTWASELKELSSNKEEVQVITNGYDHEDFSTKSVEINENETIHIGSMNADRNPEVLFNAFGRLKSSHPEIYNKIKLHLIGNIDHAILQTIEEMGIEDRVVVESFLPHHEVIRRIQEARLLLLVINNSPNSTGIIPGKMYEYLGAKRPILAIGPHQGDAKDIMEQFNQCTYISFDDVDRCVEALIDAYSDKPDNIGVDDPVKYSRKELAGQYLELIKKLNQ